MNWIQYVNTQVAIAAETADCAAFQKWEAIRRKLIAKKP